MKELRREAKPLVEQEFKHDALKSKITISNKGIKEWLNQPHTKQYIKNELLLELDALIRTSKYIGAGVDKHDKDVVAHLFEIEIEGEKSWIIAKEMVKGKVSVYSISDSDKILNIIKAKPTK